MVSHSFIMYIPLPETDFWLTHEGVGYVINEDEQNTSQDLRPLALT